MPNDKIGSVIVSLSSTSLQPREDKIIQHPNTSGIILFSRNYGSKQQLEKFVSQIKALAYAAGKKYFAIMVDHEGGSVQRFRREFTALPPVKNIGIMYDQAPELGLKMAWYYGFTMAKELKKCGVDISLAPVCDLDTGNIVISGLDRSFHENPKIVVRLTNQYIQGMQAAGMLATLKHYPGHGGKYIGDSHNQSPIDHRADKEIFNKDFWVFKKLIELNAAAAIMPAHITYDKVDPFHTAGTSEIWLKKILRDKLKFNGVIISDCLSMAGAEGNSYLSKIEKALEYGSIALFCNQTPKLFLKVLEQLKYTVSPIESDRIQSWFKGTSPDKQGRLIQNKCIALSWEAQKKDTTFFLNTVINKDIQEVSSKNKSKINV